MSIIELQRRIREAGRIRIGQQVETQNGKRRPAKLETFRITSADVRAIKQLAGLYGGTPREWDAPSGRQWEVVTETDELDVIVPPSDMAFSQHYEAWAAGGCQRRCDGITEQLTDGPCLCDPDDRECSPHTRLSVMLRDLAGLGVWRLDTQGWYAAVELAGAVQVVQAAAGAGVMLPARLRLEQRQIKRPNEPRRDFAVPVLDVEITPAQLLGGQSGGMALHSGAAPAGAPALDAGDQPAPAGNLTPVPPTVPERPAATIADQAAVVEDPPARQRRANAAQPIPSTGIEPRTAAEAAADPATDDAAAPVDDLETMTHSQLREECKRLGAKVSGKKSDLRERIRQARASGSATSSKASETGDGQPPAPPPPDDPHQPSGQRQHLLTDPSTIRENQLKRIQIRMRELGMRGESGSSTDHLYRAAMRSAYQGRNSVSELSEQEASSLIRVLEEGQTTKDGEHRSPEDFASRFLEVGAAQIEREDTADVDTGSEEASDA